MYEGDEDLLPIVMTIHLLLDRYLLVISIYFHIY
jgi:hypothetical protein